MKTYFIFNGSTASTIRFNLQNPGPSYIGQSITIANYNGNTGTLQIGLVSTTENGVAMGSTYNSGAYITNGNLIVINGVASKTFTYIGSGSVNWIVSF
jgi:hypothetical protein